MINKIIEAISSAVSIEFGEGYECHMEEEKQDLKEPCFFIILSESALNLYMGQKYKMDNSFSILYYPGSDEIERECNDTASRLCRCLEYIYLEGEELPIRGSGIQYEVIDDVLKFNINYNMFVYITETEEDTTMETLEYNINVKDGDTDAN